MTDTATPKRPGRPARGPKYPAALPRTMTTDEQRRAVDERQKAHGETLGEMLRSLVDDGLALDAAFMRDPELREDIERIARGAGADLPTALETMLRFAVTESRRRLERDRRIATLAAESFARDGVPFDGLAVGTADVTIEG